VDVSKPNPARVYDCLLGGANNFEVDRGLAKRLIEMVPDVAFTVIENRSFLRRAVAFLAKAGIDQFLDLGSGIPTVGNTHEVAQQINPACRVLHVDQEAVAVARSDLLPADNPKADVLRADVRRPAEVLRDPKTKAMLDFGRPVAILMFAVVHFMDADDKPADVTRTYRDATVPGSYLALSHITSDGHPDIIDAVAEYSTKAAMEGNLRGRDEILAFFDGYDLVEPGVVFTPEWRGELNVCEPWRSAVYAGIGRKA
jgi:hypothetical protein